MKKVKLMFIKPLPPAKYPYLNKEFNKTFSIGTIFNGTYNSDDSLCLDFPSYIDKEVNNIFTVDDKQEIACFKEIK